MRQTLYAVVRHRGQWGIRVRGEFFACDNYRVALDVAPAAADLLARHRSENARPAALQNDPGRERAPPEETLSER